MARITFRTHDGAEQTVDARAGLSLMEAAVFNGVPGIDADCGGACSCATCHVYVAPEWAAATGEPAMLELEMLDMAHDRRATSRLSCQIRITDELDGLVVETPDTQASA